MKVIVSDIKQNEDGVLVCFQCSAGQGLGRFSKGVILKNNFGYDVEVDIHKTITDLFFEKIAELPSNAFKLKGDDFFVSGLVEAVDEDGMAYFRLAADCLVMIECGDTTFYKGEMITLKMLGKDFLLTAQGL